MKRILLGALAILAMHLPAHAVTVLLNGTDASVSGAKVQDDFSLVGFVGDHIELVPGEHHIRITGPREYSLVVDLQVSLQAIAVIASRVEAGNCKPNFEVRWEQPVIQSMTSESKAKKRTKAKAFLAHGTKPAEASAVAAVTDRPNKPSLWILSIPAPVFGAPLNSGSCALPSMLGCNQRMMIVDFQSTPPGAEIWVNEVKVGSTNAALSVPYCPQREQVKKVLMRLPGRKNCSMQLAVVEDGKRTLLGCELASVP